VFRLSDAEAEVTFREVRWPETEGKPVCPKCGGLDAYECRRPKGALRFRCKACRADFTITSGTLFDNHKLPLRMYLAAIAVFCNEVKGKSMVAMSRDLGLAYKSAFVLSHKMREAMAEEMKGRVMATITTKPALTVHILAGRSARQISKNTGLTGAFGEIRTASARSW
jgi:transposase-like protein